MDSFFNKLILHKNECFLKSEEGDFSYDDLLNRIYFFERKIEEKSIKQGETIALLGDFDFDCISLFFALVRKRTIVCLISKMLSSKELNSRIEEFSPKYILEFKNKKLVFSNYNSKEFLILKSLILEQKPGLVLFTSGSTGKPKGIVHNLDLWFKKYSNKRTNPLKFLVFFLLDHVGGIDTLFSCMSVCACMIIPKKREPFEICLAIEKHSVEILQSTPTFLNLLLLSTDLNNYNLLSLKKIVYGTEPMPETLLLRLQEEFPKVRFVQTFGTTETGVLPIKNQTNDSKWFCFNEKQNCTEKENVNFTKKSNFCNEMSYKISEGELFVRCQTQCLGCLTDTEDKSRDWIKTGDFVCKNDDNFVKILGRKSEIINVGGLKVFPVEIESVLLEIPFIQDCLVFGKKNQITGEIVCADIILKSFYKNQNIDICSTRKLIREHCKTSLSSYKIPVYLDFKDSLECSHRSKKKRIRS